MCLSPKTSRSNINFLFNEKNNNRNSSNEDNDIKYSKKRLSSRNNEVLKNQKRNIYKNLIPSNLIQFSSSNSTYSSRSNINNAKTHTNIFNYYDKGYKNPDHIKRNMKYFKRQDYSNILINYTKEKNDYMFDKYMKKKMSSKILESKSNNNIKTRHNRSLSKNINPDLAISKIVDQLAKDNINKVNSFNLNLNMNHKKFELEKTFLGPMTTREFNINSNSIKNINFPISPSPSQKGDKSMNNINSFALSRLSALVSSTKNIYSRKTSRQMKSSKPNCHNSNDNGNNNEKNNYTKNKKSKMMNSSKSKDNTHNLTFNNYCKMQKKYSNDLGLNNNKIEYVQINLFNNDHHDDNKFSNEKNYFFNKIDKKELLVGDGHIRNLKKNKEKEVKLFENEINCSNDGLYMTKSFLNFSDKGRLSKDIFTPEENHFQAINYLQQIKSNSHKFC